ncbi:MAG: glycosyltransferase family 2 protein [Planctomycetota bacterium]|nr:glycosyltransferase family 2 protein [Planctomycetota bacterium]MDA1105330.1 glycosyltransferase family 2 protein [Planctomycetota bacterium]
MAQLPVTVVVPVKNEEKNLPRCLARLKSFARVVVVDSGSTDRTPEITREAGAEYVLFQWDGKYPKKRNWYLLNHHVSTPWVLFLDADEYIPESFVDELERVLAATSHVGFWIHYENHFMGRLLRHGSPMVKLALFRSGAGLYEKIDENQWSTLDMEVHEHPVLEGTVGTLSATIEHNDYKGLHAYIARHNDYSSWEASRRMKLDSTPEAWSHFTPVQRRKYRGIDKWWTAPSYAAYAIVFKLGVLDGIPGICFGLMKGIYFFQIWLKIRELRREQAAGSSR